MRCELCEQVRDETGAVPARLLESAGQFIQTIGCNDEVVRPSLCDLIPPTLFQTGEIAFMQHETRIVQACLLRVRSSKTSRLCERLRGSIDGGNGQSIHMVAMMLVEPIENGQCTGARSCSNIEDSKRLPAGRPVPVWGQFIEQHLDFRKIDGKEVGKIRVGQCGVAKIIATERVPSFREQMREFCHGGGPLPDTGHPALFLRAIQDFQQQCRRSSPLLALERRHALVYADLSEEDNHD
jgi:hypothetical protein